MSTAASKHDDVWYLRQSIERMDEAIQVLKQIAVRQEEADKARDRRTEMVEESLQLMREEIQKEREKDREKLEPIRRHVDLMNSLCKIFAATCTAGASLLGAWRVIAALNGHG